MGSTRADWSSGCPATCPRPMGRRGTGWASPPAACLSGSPAPHGTMGSRPTPPQPSAPLPNCGAGCVKPFPAAMAGSRVVSEAGSTEGDGPGPSVPTRPDQRGMQDLCPSPHGSTHCWLFLWSRPPSPRTLSQGKGGWRRHRKEQRQRETEIETETHRE